jgi:hypothetical protein
VSFGKYDPPSHSWKTFPDFFPVTISARFSEGWPRAGTTRGGIAYRLPESEPRIGEHVSGFSLPTPTVGAGKQTGGNVRKWSGQNSLQAMRMWPTPGVPNGGRTLKPGTTQTGMTPDGKKRQVGLENAIRMWPSPAARDCRSGLGRQPNRHTPQLAEKVAMYPTPDVGAAKGRGSSSSEGRSRLGGTLNPPWVEWLMGWPIGWTACEPLATDRFRQWFSAHGGN